MERIKQLSNDSYGHGLYSTSRREVELPTQRGPLRIAIEERPDHSKYF